MRASPVSPAAVSPPCAVAFTRASALAFLFPVETVAMEPSALMASVSFFSPNNEPLLTPNH